VGSEVTADPLVVLDGATIVSVQQGVQPPEGADVVDLGDATLMPGLIDTHVHLAFDSSVDPVGTLAARTDEQALAAAREATLAASPGGVTTVRDLGDRNYLTLGLRDDPGLPTILSAGPPITTPADIATSWAAQRTPPRRVSGPPSGSTWNGMSTSSRSWPAAAR
jgi:imidazolonepropionase-like amidohydrolase